MTAVTGRPTLVAEFEAAHDDYSAILAKALADRLAEAFAERLHERVRRELWGYAPDEALSNDDLIAERYQGIRPGARLSGLPRPHREADAVRAARRRGPGRDRAHRVVAMLPGASVSGLYLWHPQSHYFGIGRIGRDQLEDYAAAQGHADGRGGALARAEPAGRRVTGPTTGPGHGMDARGRFRDRLAAGPLLADGATGTLLFSRGIPQRAVLDELVASRPELVGAIHREYLAAGADIIETATFGANRIRLAPFGLADRTAASSGAGAARARGARRVGPGRLVAGSIGPLGAPTREIGPPVGLRGPGRVPGTARRAARRRRRPARVRDVLVDLDHLADRHRRGPAATADLPIVALLTFGEEIALADGAAPGPRRPRLAARRPRRHRRQLRRRAGRAVSTHSSAMDAGSATRSRSCPTPGCRSGSRASSCTPPDPTTSAGWSPRMLDAGARDRRRLLRDDARARRRDARARSMRRAARRAAAPRRPSRHRAAPAAHRSRRATAGAATDAAPPPSRLRRALPRGRYVISVEIDPPRSIRIERTIEAARLLHAAGVDLVNVSDSAMARVRMGALAVAFGIQHDLDLECVVHVHDPRPEPHGARVGAARRACAGRPRHPGAHRRSAADRRLPGGHGRLGRRFDRARRHPARLNRGEDAAGSPIGQPAAFTIACALDPTAADATTEWDRLERKLEAGAHLIMTQPLYASSRSRRCSPRPRRRFGPRGFPVPVLLGRAAAAVAPGTPSSCTTRCPGSRSPTRRAGTRCTRPATRGAEVGLRDRRRAAGRGRDRVAGHVRHAQLRPLRAGRRAGPPAACHRAGPR